MEIEEFNVIEFAEANEKKKQKMLEELPVLDLDKMEDTCSKL